MLEDPQAVRQPERADSGPAAEQPAGHPIQAALLGLLMLPMLPLRRAVVPEARGRVLEIGCGTGMNFAHYGGIDALYAIEPDPHMLRRARRRASRLTFPVQVEQAGAERLPYPDAFFDTVLVTWVLCTIPDPAAALREARRVLRPGGRLVYVEHTRAHGRVAAWMQDKLTPGWMKLFGGCHLNRDSVARIRDAGFARVEERACGRDTWTMVPQYRGEALKDRA